MIEIKNEERAYFAGLFDGEGCVHITRSTRSSGSISYTLCVAFGLTYKPVLLRMQKLFGGNVYTKDMTKHKNSNATQKAAAAGCFSLENLKQMYYYQIHNRNALYFLKVIEPFCDEKKQQVALAISYEQGKRPCAGVYGRSDREIKRCEFFYHELQRLKHEQCTIEDETDYEDEQQDLFSFEAEP